MRAKWHKSLLVRYLLLIVLAIMLWPLVIPASIIIYNAPHMFRIMSGVKDDNPYRSREVLTELWHGEAAKLDGVDEAGVTGQLEQLKKQLPETRMFWVDGEGRLVWAQPEQMLPAQWTAGNSIVFMKQAISRDPFTVVAFIGEKPEQGFMVLQVDHQVIRGGDGPVSVNRYFLLMLTVIFVLFLIVSGLFFYLFRRRLVFLEKAMAVKDANGLPLPVPVKQEDEIGQLEHAFNRMIGELQAGRSREQEEERLRKQLIANLSHDLRTPLTIIRTHAYSLRSDNLSGRGKESLALIESKSDDLNRLIDNLLSYTLLAAGKYPYLAEQVDMARLMRTAAAGWYPLFEAADFEVDVELPDHPVYWQVDPGWMKRIVDNLLQNVLRHAKTGRYVGMRLLELPQGSMMVIEDRGPGDQAATGEKGAGIGLAIVALMTQEMRVDSSRESLSTGTRVCLYSPKPS